VARRLRMNWLSTLLRRSGADLMHGPRLVRGRISILDANQPHKGR
jgi:hypothetical protein